MIPTGSKDLDETFKGYNKEITMLYGPPASGKTNFCLLCTVFLANQNKKIIFLDTENSFSPERVLQLGGSKETFNNIFLIRLKDFKDQYNTVKNLINSKVDLIIIDSLTFFYRKDLKINYQRTNRKMAKQLQTLAELTRKGIPVIVTNQVYTDLNDQTTKSIGGEMLKNWSKRIIHLNKENNKRIAEEIKPSKSKMFFKICNEGILKD